MKAGDTVAVVGDGAVGLCAVLAAKRLGANGSSRSAGTPPGRSSPAPSAPPTSSRAAARRPPPRSWSSRTASASTPRSNASAPARPWRPRSRSRARLDGRLRRVPHGIEFPVMPMFFRNKGVLGGPAPVRALPARAARRRPRREHRPRRVFDFDTDLDGVGKAYAAMDDRRRSSRSCASERSDAATADRHSTIFQNESLRRILPSAKLEQVASTHLDALPVGCVPDSVHSDTPRSPQTQCRSSPSGRRGGRRAGTGCPAAPRSLPSIQSPSRRAPGSSRTQSSVKNPMIASTSWALNASRKAWSTA